MDELVPLTEEDRRVLADNLSVLRMMASAGVILAVVALIPLAFLHTLPWLVIFPTVSIVAVVFAIVFFNLQRPVSKDLRLGQKQRINGPVEAQNVDVKRTKDEQGVESAATYHWWIQVGGKKITVTEDQYYQFKKGDFVEAFVAPNSGTVFGLSKEFLRRPFG